MLVVMQPNASAADIEKVCDEIVRQGFKPLPMPGAVRTAIGLLGDDAQVDWSYIEGLPSVANVLIVQKPYRQAAREWKNENTIVEIAPGVRVGGSDVVVFAGPCSVESEAQILASAHAVRNAGQGRACAIDDPAYGQIFPRSGLIFSTACPISTDTPDFYKPAWSFRRLWTLLDGANETRS